MGLTKAGVDPVVSKCAGEYRVDQRLRRILYRSSVGGNAVAEKEGIFIGKPLIQTAGILISVNRRAKRCLQSIGAKLSARVIWQRVFVEDGAGLGVSGTLSV